MCLQKDGSGIAQDMSWINLTNVYAYTQLKQVSEDNIYPGKCGALSFLFYSISFFSVDDQLNKLILVPANGTEPMVLRTLN